MLDRELIARCRASVAALERYQIAGVQRVGWGYKYVGGKRTDKICVSVGVERKLAPHVLSPRGIRRVPSSVNDLPTDVREVGIYRAPRPLAISVSPKSFTARRRPAAGGDSIGHRDITAGTLGAWLRAGRDDLTHVILSNNHVLANSNDAVLGDFIYQPGPYDGGTDVANRVARLEQFVRINFGNGDDKSPKKNSLGSLWFSVLAGIANAPARWRNCPRRLVLTNLLKHRHGVLAVEQPSPNLVDAAIAREFGSGVVSPEIRNLGIPLGFRDLELGDKVMKSGRTTETTRGTVVVVEATASVSYGTGKGIAQFRDQFIIESDDVSKFSAGGDSGSVILTEDGFMVGLLFAGSDTETIANRMSNVISYLGVRL